MSNTFLHNNFNLKNISCSVSILLIWLFLFCPNYASAIGLGAGVSAASTSDDLYHPAVTLGLSSGKFASNLHYWGRKYSLITEHSFLVNGNYVSELNLFSTKSLFVAAGAAAYTNYINLKATNISSAKTEIRFSPGFSFGIWWNILNYSKYKLKLGWQGFLFPAGINIIFLATDRIQAISILQEIEL